MNRYKISAKLDIFDTTNTGDLAKIEISDPPSLVSPRQDGNSRRECHIEIKTRGVGGTVGKQNEQREPVVVEIEFDALDLKQAVHWGSDELEARADLLAAFTSNVVKIKGRASCHEITPNKTEGKKIHIPAEAIGSVTVLNKEFVGHVMAGVLPGGSLPPPVLRSMRWLRKGLASYLPEDMFFCFWISLEAVGGEFTQNLKKVMECPRCRNLFKECPKCGENTEVRASANEGMRVLLEKYVKDGGKEFRELNKMRGKLLHGNVQITEKLRDELVTKLGMMRTAIHGAYESLLGIEPGKFPYGNRPMIFQTALTFTFSDKRGIEEGNELNT